MRTKDPITGLTAKQERFAQLVAAGATQSDAYRQAYDVSPDTHRDTVIEDASHLAAHPNVSPRIQELKATYQAAIVAELAWDNAKLVKEADRHRELALSGGWRGVGSANGALEIIGRATGLLADKPTPPSTAIQIVFVTESQETVVSVVEGKLVDEKVAATDRLDNDNRNKEA